MQRIEIKYLGPVKELNMEIKDFNLLIGEQTTGKSTVAKNNSEISGSDKESV